MREDLGPADVDQAWTLIREQVESVRSQLPAGAGAPDVERRYTGAATLVVALSWDGQGEENLAILSRLADDLEARLGGDGPLAAQVKRVADAAQGTLVLLLGAERRYVECLCCGLMPAGSRERLGVPRMCLRPARKVGDRSRGGRDRPLRLVHLRHMVLAVRCLEWVVALLSERLWVGLM